MSLTIIKAGILDTIQDEGRFGFQALGINPGGAMDLFSARLANCLLGKPMSAPVIEMHFPAATIAFDEATIICLTGADFSPTINDAAISMNRPLIVNKGAILKCKKVRDGARVYLSTLHNFDIAKWLNSYSTNLKAEAGGLHGQSLKTGDKLSFEKLVDMDTFLDDKAFKNLPWYAQPQASRKNEIIVIKGSEWSWLDAASQQAFLEKTFTITKVADRMGYRLNGTAINLKTPQQLVSSAVTFGTIQLLPSGQLILLMADHQTTGGYPRIATVISADLLVLAQMNPGDSFSFVFTDVATAEQKILEQYNYLQSMQYASHYKLEKFLHDKL